MGGNKKKLFTTRGIPEKLRIQLRNALIRSTRTYAMHTQEITGTQEKKKYTTTNKTWRETQQKMSTEKTKKRTTPGNEKYTQKQNSQQ